MRAHDTRGSIFKGTYFVQCLALLVMAGVFFVAAGRLVAEQTEIQTKKGLHFAVPTDWPVEEHAGIVAPVPVQDYVLKKFGEIQSEFDDVRRLIEDKSRTSSGGSSSTMQSDPYHLVERVAALEKSLEPLATVVQTIKGIEGPVKKMEESQKTIDEDLQNLKAFQEDIERRLGTVEFKLNI